MLHCQLRDWTNSQATSPNWGSFLLEILVDFSNWSLFFLFPTFNSWYYVLNSLIKSEPSPSNPIKTESQSQILCLALPHLLSITNPFFVVCPTGVSGVLFFQFPGYYCWRASFIHNNHKSLSSCNTDLEREGICRRLTRAQLSICRPPPDPPQLLAFLANSIIMNRWVVWDWHGTNFSFIVSVCSIFLCFIFIYFTIFEFIFTSPP